MVMELARYMHMLPYILHFKNNYGGKMVKSREIAL